MNEVVGKVAMVHADLDREYTEWYKLLRVVAAAITGEEDLSQEDRADLVYFMKQLADSWDDLRKEANKIREVLDNIMGTVWVADSLNGKTKQKSVKGTIGLVTPKMKITPKIPSPRTEPTKYGMMLKDLGVTNDEVIERGVLRLHWPSMTEWLTELAEQGKPAPKGVDADATDSKYTSSVRKRADVVLDDYRKELIERFDMNESTNEEL